MNDFSGMKYMYTKTYSSSSRLTIDIKACNHSEVSPNAKRTMGAMNNILNTANTISNTFIVMYIFLATYLLAKYYGGMIDKDRFNIYTFLTAFITPINGWANFPGAYAYIRLLKLIRRENKRKTTADLLKYRINRLVHQNFVEIGIFCRYKCCLGTFDSKELNEQEVKFKRTPDDFDFYHYIICLFSVAGVVLNLYLCSFFIL
jgi:hypothetical protein